MAGGFKPNFAQTDGAREVHFDPPLLSVLFVVAMLLYVTVPLLVLVHELGHAFAAIRAGRRPVVIIGKTPALIVHQFRRFDLQFHPRLGMDQFYPRTQPSEIPRWEVGSCDVDQGGLTVDQLRSIYSAGPHASILAGLAFVALAWLAPAGSLLFWLAVLTAAEAFLQGLGNLVPKEHEGLFFSDGARMARLRGFDGDLVLVSADERGDVFLPADHLGTGNAARAGGAVGGAHGRAPSRVHGRFLRRQDPRA